MEDPTGGSISGRGGPGRGALETPRRLGAGVLCPQRCGRDRCAPAQSPPPGSSPPTRRRRWPENGGGKGLEQNLTGRLAGPAGRAPRRPPGLGA